MLRLFIINFLVALGCYGSVRSQTSQDHYLIAYNEFQRMLKDEQPVDFKRAVFISENAFYNGLLSYDAFESYIDSITQKLRTHVQSKNLSKYKTAYNWAVFTYLKESSDLNNYIPYTYDFNDFLGTKNWENMLVTKLLKNKTGNCHSIPLLYKILCDALGAKSQLALAPNHLYIKHIDEHGQWANIELTSGGFPKDAWLIEQLNIPLEGIQKGAYMRPLTEKESIALCLFDLAQGYQYLYGFDLFYLDMIELGLTHFSTCIPLWQCKLNYYNFQKTLNSETSDIQINETLLSMRLLGYQEQDIHEYEDWVENIQRTIQIK